VRPERMRAAMQRAAKADQELATEAAQR
jgi:hypothetical protein